MRFIYLFFFTFIFVLDSSATELTYSEKILFNAEYDRLELTLTDLVEEIKEYRSNIESGEKSFNESRNLLELIFVFALETLHKNNQTSQFRRITQILDNEHLRRNIYYPVSRMSGFSKKVRWIKIGDEKCINLTKEEEIETGLFVNIEISAFEHLGIGENHLRFKDVYINRKGETKSYNLAYFSYEEGASIGPITAAFTEKANNSVRYYNCDYVNQAEETQNLYEKTKKRYLHLASILDREPKKLDPSEQPTKLSDLFDGLDAPKTTKKAVNLETEERKTKD